MDEQGNRINFAYVKKLVEEWGVVNLTEENVKGHWKLHCRVTTSEAVEAEQDAAYERMIQILRGEFEVDVNTDLDRIWAMGMARLESRIARGEDPGITPDLMMKVAAEKTRRQHSETQDELIRMLTGGIQRHIGGGAKSIGEADVVGELPVVDAEYSEVGA